MIIEDSVKKLQNFVVRNEYNGYDPYDALKSPLFNLPFFKTNKIVRFGTQQLVKRFPLNIRPILRVPKGLNPVTLGLFIQGYAYLIRVYPEKKDHYTERIIFLTDFLNNLIPKGYSGACWGYDFDWEARNASIGAYQPTVVATGIITNGLYHAWNITGLDKLRELVISSSEFVMSDLNRSYEGDSFCFSYSPFDEQRVYNASMKGVRLLSQVFSITNDDKIRQTAKKAVNYVINGQREDGSWAYSLAKAGGWIDNYHTGYILDCLDEYVNLCSDNEYLDNLENGFSFYKQNFFDANGRPKFYSDNVYPSDCTAASQSILTLSRFGDIEQAAKVALWTINNMQSIDGSFYFRKFRRYTIKTPFMRWSNAWMFTSLCYLLLNLNRKSI